MGKRVIVVGGSRRRNRDDGGEGGRRGRRRWGAGTETQVGFGSEDESMKKGVWSKGQSYHLLLAVFLYQDIPSDLGSILWIQTMDPREHYLGRFI